MQAHVGEEQHQHGAFEEERVQAVLLWRPWHRGCVDQLQPAHSDEPKLTRAVQMQQCLTSMIQDFYLH